MSMMTLIPLFTFVPATVAVALLMLALSQAHEQRARALRPVTVIANNNQQ